MTVTKQQATTTRTATIHTVTRMNIEIQTTVITTLKSTLTITRLRTITVIIPTQQHTWQ